jgi:hypothetical protein
LHGFHFARRDAGRVDDHGGALRLAPWPARWARSWTRRAPPRQPWPPHPWRWWPAARCGAVHPLRARAAGAMHGRWT